MRDSLNVLDIALRSGCEDPNIAYDALTLAVHLNQYESALTYAERYESQKPGETWVHYYRAVAFIELGRFEEALEAVAAEAEREDSGRFHLDILQTTALFGLGKNSDAAELLGKLIETQMSDVIYIVRTGILRLLELLWRHMPSPENNPESERLLSFALAICVTPNDFFEHHRGEESDDVGFFQVRVQQSLPTDWSQSTCCMHNEKGWTSYQMEWGVLAESEAVARDTVSHWQNRCHGEPFEIIDVEAMGSGYSDRPGIVWQGWRFNPDDQPD